MLTFHGVKVLSKPFFRICDLTAFNVHCTALCIGDCLDHNCLTASIYGVLSVRVLVVSQISCVPASGSLTRKCIGLLFLLIFPFV